LSMAVGKTTASTDEESEAPDMLAALTSFKDAKSDRLHRFSSTLGVNDLDGDKGHCVRRLHAVLLSLSKLQNEVPQAQNGSSAELLADGEMGEVATSSWRRRRRRRRSRRRRGWGNYGFDATNGCPASRTAEWECRVGPANGNRRRHTGPYYTGGSAELGGYSSDASVNIKCRSTSSSNSECIGLCGKMCDCFESLCPGNYKCGYNPYCCGHDKTCSRRRTGDVRKCLSVGAAMKACR